MSKRNDPIPAVPVDRRRLLKLALGAPLALGGFKAAQAAPSTLNPSFNRGLDPNAGSWDTWLIKGGASLEPPPPGNIPASRAEARQLLQYQAQRTSDIRALVQFWDPQGGVPVWMAILLDKVRTTNVNPVLASRAMALLGTAMADATIAAWASKWKFRRPSPSALLPRLRSISQSPVFFPTYASEHAAVARAAATVLNYLFPNSQDATVNGQTLTFDEIADQAINSRLYSGANYPSDLEAGAGIGDAVGDAAVQRGQGDGSTTPWMGSIPVGAQFWIPTPPGFAQNPLLPGAGYWQTWVLSSGAQFRSPDRQVFVNGSFSPNFLAQVQEVASVAAGLTDDQKQIATFWADGGGTVTPPGHWMQFALAQLQTSGWSAVRAARALALLGSGVADSAIACWDSKYTYWLLRPISAIRNIPNQPFTNPTFNSFIGTPPFPSYTSGHSTFSGCAAEVMQYLFPRGRVPDAFGHLVGYREAANQAAISRVYGGIHYTMDSDEGLVCGRAIAREVIARAKSDGS